MIPKPRLRHHEREGHEAGESLGQKDGQDLRAGGRGRHQIVRGANIETETCVCVCVCAGGELDRAEGRMSPRCVEAEVRGVAGGHFLAGG